MAREKRPAFPFYPKDWLSSASVSSMPLAAQGLYVRLMAYAWQSDGLPFSDEALRNLVGVSRAEWRKLWPLVAPMWREENGRLYNAKLEQVRAESLAFSEAAKVGGRASAAARAQRNGNGTPNETGNDSSTESPTNVQLAVAVASTTTDPTTTTSLSEREEHESQETSGQTRLAACELLELWAQHGTGSPVLPFSKLSWKEKLDLRDALRRHCVSEWDAIFRRARASDSLSGRDGRRPPMTLWRVLDEATKIVAGVYDNREAAPAAATPKKPGRWAIDIDAEVARQREAAAARGRVS